MNNEERQKIIEETIQESCGKFSYDGSPDFCITKDEYYTHSGKMKYSPTYESEFSPAYWFDSQGISHNYTEAEQERILAETIERNDERAIDACRNIRDAFYNELAGQALSYEYAHGGRNELETNHVQYNSELYYNPAYDYSQNEWDNQRVILKIKKQKNSFDIICKLSFLFMFGSFALITFHPYFKELNVLQTIQTSLMFSLSSIPFIGIIVLSINK